MLLSNSRGGYSFLRGIGPYSAGVIADAIVSEALKQAHRLLTCRSGEAPAIDRDFGVLIRQRCGRTLGDFCQRKIDRAGNMPLLIGGGPQHINDRQRGIVQSPGKLGKGNLINLRCIARV